METATRERQGDELEIDALERVFDDHLNPRQMTHNHNPNAHLYVDTIYTAKGLEAEHVILLNWDIRKRQVDGYAARLWYVGLTRSRGSITIVVPGDNTKFVSAMPLSVIVSEARKVGIEVPGWLKKMGRLPGKFCTRKEWFPISGSEVSEVMRTYQLRLIYHAYKTQARVNISISDALHDLENNEVATVLNRVSLDIDFVRELSMEEARKIARSIIARAHKVYGVTPIITRSGCHGIHITYYLNDLVPAKDAKNLRMQIYEDLRLKDLGIGLDEHALNLEHLFRLPLTINTKCNSETRFIHYLGVSNHVLDALSLYRNAVYRQVMEGVIPIELPAKPREYVHVSLTLPFEERPRSGVKCLDITDFGRVCYPRAMSGLGWIRYIVRNKVYIKDCRQNLIWYALSWAPFITDRNGEPLITEQKAIEYIRETTTKYPDPDNELDPDDYVKMLQRYLKNHGKKKPEERIKPPSWERMHSQIILCNKSTKQVILTAREPQLKWGLMT